MKIVIKIHENESHSIVSNSLWPHALYSPWNSLGQSTGVGSLSFLQGILPTQKSTPGLPQWRWILYQSSHKGSSRILEWIVYPFSNLSSQPRNWTKLSCIADGCFTSWAIRQVLKKSMTRSKIKSNKQKTHIFLDSIKLQKIK